MKNKKTKKHIVDKKSTQPKQPKEVGRQNYYETMRIFICYTERKKNGN